MPRLMPTYFAAYCWNKSPMTQMNPPAISNQSTARDPANARASSAAPPEYATASPVIIPSSPIVKKATKVSGLIPVR